ncbi:hypothetical protein AVP42_02199 [Agromyces sp. NDB4Y10]|nr:hypothetical protein AVP42_02199 [Agromyces sp. NDB4Y10]
MPARRTAARPLSSSAAIHARTIAGARLGAQAITIANASEAAAAAAHEVAAANMRTASHGSRMCTMTAAGRPAASESSSGGAAAHRTPPSTRSEVRSVSLAAANHPPRLDRGMASSQRASSAQDGFQKAVLPSRASTPAKGSAAPVNPPSTSRHP